MWLETKWAWTRFVTDPSFLVDHVQTIRPACIGSLGGVVESVDHRRKLDAQFHHAHLPQLAALLEVLWACKHNVIVQVVRILPYVTGVRIANVDHIERHAVAILIVESVQGRNLPPKRWSGVAAEYQDDGLFAAQRR